MSQILIPCGCGATPTIVEHTLGDIDTAQVVCECGRKGAVLMTSKEAQRQLMLQCAADGWNLGST